MKCEKCAEAGLKSTVYVPMGHVSTCMAFSPFYDEDGAYHYHDENTHSESWSCSNGHRWHLRSQGKCPAPNCSWNDRRRDEIVWEVTTPTNAAPGPSQSGGGVGKQ